MSFASNNPAPRITGVDIRNENFAADSLSIFRNRAVEIVMPDLETPGMIAKTCMIPIKRACLIPMSLSFRFDFDR